MQVRRKVGISEGRAGAGQACSLDKAAELMSKSLASRIWTIRKDSSNAGSDDDGFVSRRELKDGKLLTDLEGRSAWSRFLFILGSSVCFSARSRYFPHCCKLEVLNRRTLNVKREWAWHYLCWKIICVFSIPRSSQKGVENLGGFKERQESGLMSPSICFPRQEHRNILAEPQERSSYLEVLTVAITISQQVWVKLCWCWDWEWGAGPALQFCVFLGVSVVPWGCCCIWVPTVETILSVLSWIKYSCFSNHAGKDWLPGTACPSA